MRCSRCHADNPAGMKFCGQCGRRSASGVRHAERPTLLKTGSAASAGHRSAGPAYRIPRQPSPTYLGRAFPQSRTPRLRSPAK